MTQFLFRYPLHYKSRDLYCITQCLIVFQGTVLIKNAEELMDFSQGEENMIEAVSSCAM